MQKDHFTILHGDIYLKNFGLLPYSLLRKKKIITRFSAKKIPVASFNYIGTPKILP